MMTKGTTECASEALRNCVRSLGFGVTATLLPSESSTFKKTLQTFVADLHGDVAAKIDDDETLANERCG